MSEGGRGGTGRLERRARWLLRAYPAAYRADRGEEIIGTLLEAVPPGRDWPPSRETVALVAAGLRARRAANLRLGLAASLRQVAVVGAAVYLVQLPGLGVGAVAWYARRGHQLSFLFWNYEWLFYVLGLLALVILAAGWSGRRGLVAVCWLATDVRPLASLVFAFTVSRVVYGFAYGRPLVTVGPTVIALGIAASLVAACALAWLLRRRIHASPPMTS